MNRVQSDRYWYDEGRKTAKTETINRVLEIIDRTDPAVIPDYDYEFGFELAKEYIKNGVFALRGDEHEDNN